VIEESSVCFTQLKVNFLYCPKIKKVNLSLCMLCA
jgi:hypothetical protein